MRIAIPAALAAVALLASTTALSAPASTGQAGLADSGPVLLAQNDSASSFSLFQNVQQLQQEVRRLRGKVQMLEHRIDRNKQSRKEMYQHLDERLQALESGDTTQSEEVDEETVKKTYLAAVDQLRDGQYDKAIDSFESFVETYPDTSYTDNAWYWLGQARYVKGDLSDAASALETVVSKFPDSGKMPSTLYRLAVINDMVGKKSQAKKLLNRILDDYGSSKSADMARDKLQGMAK